MTTIVLTHGTQCQDNPICYTIVCSILVKYSKMAAHDVHSQLDIKLVSCILPLHRPWLYRIFLAMM